MKRIYSFFQTVLLALMIALALIFSSCSSNGQKKMKSPERYDLNKPEIINLSKKIDQISGIAYSPDDNSLYAIDDDNGDLYHIPLEQDPKIKKWKFGKNADFEDVVFVDSTFYVLESRGRIIKFPWKFPINDSLVKKFDLQLNGLNEFETLYYDSSSGRLILLCKECDVDKNKTVSAYAFDIHADSFITKPVLELKRKDLKKTLDEKLKRLKPSAGTMDPATGNIFIISSINKLLIVADKEYNVKDVYELNRELFGQPEGICFAPDGTLFVSNEAGPESKANILIFKRK